MTCCLIYGKSVQMQVSTDTEDIIVTANKIILRDVVDNNDDIE